MRYLGAKCTIIFGLVFEMAQLTIYGFGSEQWLMWIAGAIAATSSITYPAISAFVSAHTEPERQGCIWLSALLLSPSLSFTLSSSLFIYLSLAQ